MILPIMTIFTKLPFIGSIMGFVTKKKRLFVEYLMVGTVIVLGVMVVTLWLQKKYTESALNEVNGKVTTLQLANTMQDSTIGRLRDLRERDSRVLQNLANDLSLISTRDLEIRNQLKRLEHSDEIIKTYLHTPVPERIACLLERTCKD